MVTSGCLRVLTEHVIILHKLAQIKRKARVIESQSLPTFKYVNRVTLFAKLSALCQKGIFGQEFLLLTRGHKCAIELLFKPCGYELRVHIELGKRSLFGLLSKWRCHR